jgi:hydrogenase maturation protein HypF
MSALVKMIQVGINAPLTSSLGRIFDAVSVILNYREKISYEGEAAVALEMLATGLRGKPYPFEFLTEAGSTVIDLQPTLKEIIEELNQNISKNRIAARFHSAIIEVVGAVCQKIEKTGGLKKVCLSGGCFMNRILLEGCFRRLTDLGFEVYFNSQVPINDGGLAVGQALIANARKEQCA